MKRLSIIVPIYNVESFVERCIRSLEDQDIEKDDFEIICINDGSPDNSREVILRLGEEFGNLILIDQENQGVSCARNKGIDKAAGKYLLFIDPDDYVKANCLNGILEKADSWHAQVSFLGFTIFNEDGSVSKEILNEDNMNEVYPGIKAYFISRGDGGSDPDRMVAVLFERRFINLYALRYLPGVPYLEDGELIARILCLAQRCIFDGRSFYKRTTRRGSATKSDLFYSEQAVDGFVRSSVNLKNLGDIYSLNKEQAEFLNQPICKFAVLAIDSARYRLNFGRVNNVKKKLYNSGLRKLKLQSVSPEYLRLGISYNISVYILMIHLWILNRLKGMKIRFNKMFG